MRRVVLGAAALLVCGATLASAQIQIDAERALATRAELERALNTMPPNLRDGAQGMLIRKRLAEGDIVAGDRIQITVVGDTTLTGNFTVRSDGTIAAPNIEPISVKGVLRSELEAHLTKEAARYIKNPTVTARSLVRVAVSGAVARPGFYDLPPESPASDAVVAAGGMTNEGDVQKTIIRRSAEQMYDRDQVREFYVRNTSLDQMGLRTGDEFVVGRRGSANVLPIIGAVTGIAFAVAAFATLF